MTIHTSRNWGFYLFSLLISATSWGWGKDGHEIVAHVGGQLSGTAKSFWPMNADHLVELTNVPDWKWKSQKGTNAEHHQHWFQLDHFARNKQDFDAFPREYLDAVDAYGREVVHENGTATWRIQQFYDRIVQALRNGDLELAVQSAGIMSHYVGDLSQPLHVTENYDGQKTGNKGIHSFFESQNVRNHISGLEARVKTRAKDLLKSEAFLADFEDSALEAAFRMTRRSLSRRDTVLKIDTKYGRDKQGADMQIKIAEERLADGVASLALILMKAVDEAGVTPKGQVANVELPDWIHPDFEEEGSQVSPFSVYLERDDCYSE